MYDTPKRGRDCLAICEEQNAIGHARFDGTQRPQTHTLTRNGLVGLGES